MTSRPAASSRDNNFNLIRFMAALCVMIGHMSFIAPGPLYIFLGNGIQIMGVRTIFLLGGYLISKSWSSDPHVLRYAVKRAFRIWPALIVFTLGVALVAGPILSVLPAGEYFRNPATWQYLGAIGFYISYGLPGVFADVPYAGVVNGSLWTMPLEVALYVLVPLVLWLVSRRPWRKHASLLTAIFVGLYVVAAVLRCAVFPQWRMVIYGLDVAQFLVLGVYYMLGMLYALPQVRRFLNLQVASLLLVAAAMAQFTSYAANEVCYMLVFPYFVFSLGLCEKPLFKGFGRKTELSYGIYLYGFFVQQCLVWLCNRLGWTLPYWGLQVVSIALTMACAYLSAKLIEEPCMRLSKRLLARIPARGERATTH